MINIKNFVTPLLFTVTLFVSLYSASVFAELRMVHIDNLTMAQVKKIQSAGMDVTQIKQQSNGDDLNPSYQIDIVISNEEESSLIKEGYLIREIQPQSSTQRSLSIQSLAAATESSYFDFDTAETGLQDQIYKLAEDYPDLVSVHEIGTSINGRPILAVNVQKKKKRYYRYHNPHYYGGYYNWHYRAKPEVLFVHTMHAREWVSPYVGMRILRHLLEKLWQR